ncbi:LysR family transcriptional regulator [Roseburia hominis]
MDLKQMEYFLTIAEEGTISAAARKLHLSQPPLSAQMKLLEAEIGCRLFNRGSRRIELTEAGRLLYERAQTILRLSDLTVRELQDHRDGKAGTLRIGIVSSVGDLLLKNWALPFHQNYPHMHFELFEANTYQLLEQLGANLLDFAIVRTPFQSENLIKHTLLSEPILAAGHVSFFTPKEQKADTLPLSALADKPLILYRRWANVLNQHFDLLHLKPSFFCINDDARTCVSWADAKSGVAILPASAAALLASEDLLIKHISNPALTSDICVIHNKNGYLSSGAAAFLDYMKEHPGPS